MKAYDFEPLLIEGKHTNIVHIGWLEFDMKFNRGKAPKKFVKLLEKMIKNPFELWTSGGIHFCSICCPDADECENIEFLSTIPYGTRTIFVPGENIIFYSPTLIDHYINKHDYNPPQEFQIAVIKSSKLEDQKRIEAIKNIEPSFVHLVPFGNYDLNPTTTKM